MGLGVIGGSIAKALKRSTDHKIYAIDVSEDTLLDACSLEAIDAKATVYQIGEMDLIYLCLYPQDCISFMKANAKRIRAGTIVTDACGIKQALCDILPKLADIYGFHYVAGHPMAGKEKSGFSQSDPSLFVNASYIIVDSGAPKEAVNAVAGLAESMGFGRIVYTTAREHDEIIAFTSQVPHVLACAYVLSPRCKRHQGFSAGSYRDVSRVADINGTLWTRLFLDNRESLTAELDTLIDNITKLKEAINTEDEATLEALLNAAAETKRSESI